MLNLLASCFSPQSYKDKDKIVKSMADTITKQFPNVNHLSIEQLQKMQKDGKKVLLVDVRAIKERKVSFLPDSISQAEFEKNMDQYSDYNIVAYCTIGHRSSEYIQKMNKEKFKGLYNLKESILGWTHRQLPLFNNQGQETKKVHVYGEPWNLAHKDYEGITE